MEEYEVQCPWCGEWVEISIPVDLVGETVQDCEVCCQAWKLVVDRRDDWGDPQVHVERSD